MKRKNYHVELPVTEKELKMIKQGAELEGRSLRTFLVSCAVKISEQLTKRGK